MLKTSKIVLFLVASMLLDHNSFSQDVKSSQDNFFEITDIAIPDSIALEVSGMAFNHHGQLGIATRQGKIWLIDNPNGQQPQFSLFASGLHEPLGLSFTDNSFYTAQRGELTKLTDRNNDGKADLFETVYLWQTTGNYHEYSYGPVLLPDGNMVVTRNLGWQESFRHMESFVKWSGWLLKIDQKGRLTPIATGMRSPAGIGFNDKGDLFYAENQGDWIGSGWITHVEEGDFTGHPEGLKWSNEPESPVRSFKNEIFSSAHGTMYHFAKSHPDLKIKLPSVWFPHGIMGISTSDIINIESTDFGPFKNQLLVGDQGQSKVMRVTLEKINGQYQGACYPFLDGFSSGVFRLLWDERDPVLYVGMTSRGWSSVGASPFGLQKVKWTGRVPFEMKNIYAKPYGFDIEFTLPPDHMAGMDKHAFTITAFSYLYHDGYGSPVVDMQVKKVEKVETSGNATIKLYIDDLKEGLIYEIRLKDLKSVKGERLFNDFAYYTLNNIPGKAREPVISHHPPNSESSEKVESCPENLSKRIIEKPDNWGTNDFASITINTKPGLKFDQEEFVVKAGSKVGLTFNNQDDMLHNLIIVEPGQLDKVGKAALSMGLDGPNHGYVPDITEVLFSTCMLQPGGSQTIYFTVPEKAGDYPFVCTLPGHYAIMNGIMKIVH